MKLKHGTLRSDYRKSGNIKLAGHVGGIYCSCCNDYRTNARNCKPLIRRRARRIAKQEKQCA